MTHMKYLKIFFYLTSIPLLSSCESAILFNSKGYIGIVESHIILVAAILMLLVVLPAIVMTILFVWKYRESKQARYTPDWNKSTKVEIVIWGIPALITVCLSFLIWIYSHKLDPSNPLPNSKPPIIIQVVSLDWKWLFIYPEQHIATINEIVFPTNVPIHFYLTSATVINSFFIPQLGSQIMTMGGMQNQLHLIANHTGNFMGISGVFSGPGFTWMRFRAIAGTEQEYNDWIAKIKKSPYKLDTNQYEELKKPSIKDPVKYFSTVPDNLFEFIIKDTQLAKQ